MTWAARYSRTEQPELTIYDGGEFFDNLSIEDAHECLNWEVCTNYHGRALPVRYVSAMDVGLHDPDLRADIAARVPVTECEEPGCVNWAMPDGRCHHLHGGGDEL